ncbi:hypothetical protein P691DRAFT_764933 [Macrolepiota fuliginosa MF-IS2]|uniref:Uncharacterized protein n=1 Tax=Macrolepiota fuliginosa MF-IS2 TaxID=1400762 RepID=A0A9P5X3T8_9AGAR|nr:hypothetical protein P691DRAFT_764933 [Macrolepiota fuliginosa MF-IS2]
MGIRVGEDAIIIIGGLDECDGTDAQRTIIQIIITSVHEQTTPFLWAFFSRPEPHIKAAFSSKQATDVCLKLNLPVSCDADGDIEAYLRDGFEMIWAKFDFPAVFIWPSEEEIYQLVDQSAGLFVYAACAIRYMENPGASGPTGRLHSLLQLGSTKTSDNTLANLDRFYTLIMEQVLEGTLPNTLLLFSALTITALCYLKVQSLVHFWDSLWRHSTQLSLTFTQFSVSQPPESLGSTPRFFVENDDLYNQIDFRCADALRRISHTTYDNEGHQVDVLGWSSSREIDRLVCRDALFHLLHTPLRRLENRGYLPMDALQQLSRVNWCSLARDRPNMSLANRGLRHLILMVRPKAYQDSPAIA